MLLKREMRPQTAGAPTPDNKWSKKLSSLTFSAMNDTTNDFGSFDNEPERGHAPARKRKSSPSGFFRSLDKTKVIIAAAIAVVLLVSVCVTIVACSGIFGSDDIKYQNNAYMSYVGKDDKHHVISNGELLDHEFQGEVDLIPAADNSFAYVFDHGDDGVYMYILEGKKLTSVLDTAVEEYIATATLEPGIIFVESGNSGLKYMFYSPEKGVQEVSKEKKKPDDFLISADAKTIIYTIEGDDANDRIPYVYENGIPDKLTPQSCTPVAVSSYGDYVYVERSGKLYAIDRTKKDIAVSAVADSENFLYILEMNVKGDEVIFCTGEGPDSLADLLDGDIFSVKTFLYRHKEKNDNVILLGNNFVTTADGAAPDVAVHKTFADKYLETDAYGTSTEEHTYHLTTKYEVETIHSHKGQFTPNGKFFYYLNDYEDLYKLDLTDKTRSTSLVCESVKTFAVTEKSNVYYIDSDNYLVFYKESTNSKPRISSEANEMSIYRCSNKLYFAENESEIIYVTEEGNEKDIAKFGSSELKAVPYFSSQVTKKAYAVVYNESAETYSIYYTSNGNRFKLIKSANDCQELGYGVEIPAPIEW